MRTKPSRREALGILGAAGLAALTGACGSPAAAAGSDAAGSDAAGEDAPTDSAGGLPKLAIIGGGIAGVATAWLLDGVYDVTLFEAEAQLGGNVTTLPFDVRGQQVLVDIGAQYFHPGLYPNYAKLLDLLGVRDPKDDTKSDLYPAASSITVFAPGETNPRFVSPVFSDPDKMWPLSADWNSPGLGAFNAMTSKAKELDSASPDWMLPLEDWLKQIGLDETQRNKIMIPWAAALFSGDIEQSRGLSALGTVVFVSRTVGTDPTATIYYQTVKHGLGSVIQKLVSQCKTLTVKTATKITGISRVGAQQFILDTAAGSQGPFTHLVMAVPGYAASKILNNLPDMTAQRTALDTVEWYDSHLAIHRDPIYAASDPKNYSFLNCRVQDEKYCEASMNLSISVAPPKDGQPTGLWKSWTTLRNVQPKEILHTVEYKHYLPTPKSFKGNNALAALQGQGNVWFAGGWTKTFDTQETALISALEVVKGLKADAGVNSQALAAAT